ncbi:MAG: class I SAM-dependent methyltransferase [Phycisphaerales bacterium]
MTTTITGIAGPAAEARPLDAGLVNAQWMRYFAPRTYTNREEKAAYIAAKYAAILEGSVLDVGCDQCPLKRHIERPDLYKGIDLAPPADIVLNLDQEPLPFDDASFDTAVCTDVLEHLERIHANFDELCRVARSRVIISLPAPLTTLLTDIGNGAYAKDPLITEGWKKFYGLPLEPPADRHRWFFGFDDARRFLTHRAAKNGWTIEQLDTEWHGTTSWRNAAGEQLLAHPNTNYGILWCVLEPAR